MKYERILTLYSLFILLSFFTMKADNWKRVEQSEKKLPEWMSTGTHEGYLMISTEAPTLQEARQMAERELLRTIVQAVATNVNYKALQTSSNTLANDRVETKEDFSSEYEMAAAKLPFIKGVSLSEAKGTYWERRENKQSRQNLYILTVLYPFSENELTQLRSQFDAYDSEKTRNFERMKSGIASVSSTEDVEEGIAALTDLKEYFFDAVRRQEAESLLKRYRDIYKSVYLEAEKTDTNRYRVSTKLNGKPFRTGRKLEVVSECANRIKVVPTPSGDGFDITFSTEDCLEGELNLLKASMRLGSARIIAELPI